MIKKKVKRPYKGLCGPILSSYGPYGPINSILEDQILEECWGLLKGGTLTIEASGAVGVHGTCGTRLYSLFL